MPKPFNGRREDLSDLHAWKMVPLSVINDTNLSPIALALFVWLFTRPEGWDYSISGTSEARGWSRNTVQKYLSELSEAGYLNIRKDEKSSKFAYVWSFNPYPNGVTRSTDTQILGSDNVSTPGDFDTDPDTEADTDAKDLDVLAAQDLSTNIEENTLASFTTSLATTKTPSTPTPQPATSQREVPVPPPYRRKPSTTIPADWEPDERHTYQAAEFGLNLRLEAEKFVNYFESTGKRKRDWPRTFHNWLIRAHEYKHPLPSRVIPQKLGGGGGGAGNGYRAFTHDD